MFLGQAGTFLSFQARRSSAMRSSTSDLTVFTVSFTMVIKRSPGGESAGGGRSTSKSTCVVPA